MIHTLVFGAPVYGHDKQLGKLERIVVDNGIANQVTVDPGLLGTERVVPINSLRESSADAIHTDLTNDDWKACASFTMDRQSDSLTDAQPDLSVLGPAHLAGNEVRDTGHMMDQVGARQTERTVTQTSVVLTSHTKVVDAATEGEERKLHGLVIDTGRPQLLLLDHDTQLDFAHVTMLDERRIAINSLQQQPLLDADRGYDATQSIDPLGDQRR